MNTTKPLQKSQPKKGIQQSMDENTKKQSLEAMKIMVKKDQLISQQLMNLLEQERRLLKQKNYDSLNELLTKKNPLIDQLKNHADIRRQWLQSLYKVADESYWREFVESFGLPELSQQWHDVNETIEKCKLLNDTNGLLITRGQKTYEQLIFLLKGGNRQADVYTAKGSKQSIRAYSSVAKA
ncbi:flagella synthesis protein FlgN [Eionea flava]